MSTNVSVLNAKMISKYLNDSYAGYASDHRRPPSFIFWGVPAIAAFINYVSWNEFDILHTPYLPIILLIYTAHCIYFTRKLAKREVTVQYLCFRFSCTWIVTVFFLFFITARLLVLERSIHLTFISLLTFAFLTILAIKLSIKSIDRRILIANIAIATKSQTMERQNKTTIRLSSILLAASGGLGMVVASVIIENFFGERTFNNIGFLFGLISMLYFLFSYLIVISCYKIYLLRKYKINIQSKILR